MGLVTGSFSIASAAGTPQAAQSANCTTTPSMSARICSGRSCARAMASSRSLKGTSSWHSTLANMPSASSSTSPAAAARRASYASSSSVSR
jgi:hypothetical protein